MTDISSNYNILNEYITNIINLLNTGNLYADNESTNLGPKSSCIIENNVNKGVKNINECLINLYSLFQNSESEQKVDVKKIQISDNGERSFDVQIFILLMLNNIETPAFLFLNITKGSDRVQRVSRRANKVSNTAQEEIEHFERIKNNLSVDEYQKMELKIKEKTEIMMAANMRVQKAINERINNFWVRKFQLMFLS